MFLDWSKQKCCVTYHHKHVDYITVDLDNITIFAIHCDLNLTRICSI